VPVGQEISTEEVASPFGAPTTPEPLSDSADPWGPPPGSGSIIVVVATDAPLLPHQCERVAQRAGLGIARVGGTGGHTSGDIFIAFATGNRLPMPTRRTPEPPVVYDVRAVGDAVIDALFRATIEATEEAIVNALVAADTMRGADGVVAHRLPHDRLVDVMRRYGRLPA
jgi:D-aminopeptidase